MTVRSHTHAGETEPRRHGSSLARALRDARRTIRLYDQYVLGGYDTEKDAVLVGGFNGWFRGAAVFPLPAQQPLFRNFDPEIAAFKRKLSGAEAILDYQKDGPLSSTPAAEAFRYWLRRCLFTAFRRIELRFHERQQRGLFAIGPAADAVLRDLREVVEPWWEIRKRAESIIKRAIRFGVPVDPYFNEVADMY